MHEPDPRCDPRSVDELLNAALSEPDGYLAWQAVGALHWRGTDEVLRGASVLCCSACPIERRLGADILGQLGVPERTFPRQCVSVLLEMLDGESEAEVLQAIFVALSHLHDPKAIPAAVRFAEHRDPLVRHAVVLALTGHEDPIAVESLIVLTRDADPYVRDWATFGLGTQSELDTPEIRDALAARLDDPDDDTRGEALVGLARRRDRRVVAAVKKRLRADCVRAVDLEAAEIMGAPELYAPLVALRGQWDGHPELLADAIIAAWLEDAIAACARE